MSTVVIYPSLEHVLQNTVNQMETKPLGLRLLSLSFFIIHLLMVAVYAYAILFSTDPYTLFLVTIGIFILLELCTHVQGCIFSGYESINGDILPSFSQAMCAIFEPVDKCGKTAKYETFILSAGVILALLKIFVLFLQNEVSGKKFRLSLK
jgi:hypothetical protein